MKILQLQKELITLLLEYTPSWTNFIGGFYNLTAMLEHTPIGTILVYSFQWQFISRENFHTFAATPTPTAEACTIS